MRQQNHRVDPLEAPESVDGGTARVAGRADDDGHVSLVPTEEVVVQLTNYTQGEVFEGEGGSMEQFGNVQAILQLCNLDGRFWI